MMKPEGQISLKGNFGETIKYDIISKNILAESERLLEATPSAQIDCENNRTDAACRVSTSLILSGFLLVNIIFQPKLNLEKTLQRFLPLRYFYAFPFKIMGDYISNHNYSVHY